MFSNIVNNNRNKNKLGETFTQTIQLSVTIQNFPSISVLLFCLLLKLLWQWILICLHIFILEFLFPTAQFIRLFDFTYVLNYTCVLYMYIIICTENGNFWLNFIFLWPMYKIISFRQAVLNTCSTGDDLGLRAIGFNDLTERKIDK